MSTSHLTILSGVLSLSHAFDSHVLGSRTQCPFTVRNHKYAEKNRDHATCFNTRAGWSVDDVQRHYGDVIMGAIASQITSLTIVYSTVYSDADQRKHQSSASLAFVRGIHRGPVNSPHKGPVTRKMFPFDDVIMTYTENRQSSRCQLCRCWWHRRLS